MVICFLIFTSWFILFFSKRPQLIEAVKMLRAWGAYFFFFKWAELTIIIDISNIEVVARERRIDHLRKKWEKKKKKEARRCTFRDDDAEDRKKKKNVARGNRWWWGGEYVKQIWYRKALHARRWQRANNVGKHGGTGQSNGEAAIMYLSVSFQTKM